MSMVEKWEYFCDRGYYDQWAVREKTATEFGDCFHVPTLQEAKGLAALLNAKDVIFTEKDFIGIIGKINMGLGEFTRVNRYAAEMIYSAISKYFTKPSEPSDSTVACPLCEGKGDLPILDPTQIEDEAGNV